ncbi:uncharacterized protein LOC129295921 [Prosopis cineraria]|uniref:uncharacterized protein LOC129295921 n=1 Tax=Prosopis cineraria TaxID=364024 RepID=UPI00240FE984|nr:uncharacterized protein LOC129295921 [Prosopis cineraria]
MENRARLRVHKTKGFKSGKKKHLVKRVVDYLKSDTFLYAPLLSSVPPDFRSLDTLHSSDRVVEFKKPVIENKPFLEELGDYVRSDVFMYAPIAGPPPSLQESLLYSERIRMSVSTTRLTMKVNQPADHLGNANERSENYLPRSGPSDQHSQGHAETVKHPVYQTCHLNSAPGNVTLNSHLTARC